MWQGGQINGIKASAVKLKKNVFLQAEGSGSKTSKGGFTKDKVREMNPSVRRAHGDKARVWINLCCHSVSVKNTDTNLVFIMLHLGVRSWFTVGITLSFYYPVLFL